MTPPKTHQPPIANAGINQTILLPSDSTQLIGTGTDADGIIVSYRWSLISGPSSVVIVDSDRAVTKIKGLVRGIYDFQFRVTDDNGLVGHADVIVSVVENLPSVASPGCNGCLIQAGELSLRRYYVAAASAGNKIVFAGGNADGIILSSRVDIYDTSTQTWSTAELSEARTGIGAVTVGNKILFAGGAKNFNYDDGWYNLSTRIDIYDVSSNTWSTAELPEPINFLWWEGATAAVGNKAFFCSVRRSDRMYVYDVPANTWSTVGLSGGRSDLVAGSVGNKVLISGGADPYERETVNIYDVNSNTRSVDSLSDRRRLLRAATLNDKIYFAGGSPFSSRVDIYENSTGSWTSSSLSRATVLAGAASAGQRVCFFGGNRVDVYDASTNSWSYFDISEQLDDGSAIIAAANNIYLTTGTRVWQMRF
jgi:hypothetical protein